MIVLRRIAYGVVLFIVLTACLAAAIVKIVSILPMSVTETPSHVGVGEVEVQIWWRNGWIMYRYGDGPWERAL